ncbi:MAG TPA: 1-deoxy-D-xylulose-5-phosphate synthase N-terminal domain-containing protein [Dissulfurispiraceae bacterium]|nr:1-deoxy-D-xylulose-5-phosphate synthase N-terminal domain-containing protein [Dissulfurispiraceae bacterium]
MRKEQLSRLKQMALKVREHCVRMSCSGGAFTGSALSCADLMVYLYGQFLSCDTGDPGRDYCFLSKGHAVPALYGTLAEMGVLRKERLSAHLSTSDDIYWHPNKNIPGVEFHSGSLGHLLPVAAGVALDCKLRGQGNRVVVILGDGELNEGSNWEACLLASACKLDNLIIIIDRNRFQANKKTEELVPLEPLEAKFRAFGLASETISGHDFEQMDELFFRIPLEHCRPSVIIAETVRGKGIPSIESRADRWFCNFPCEEVELLVKELHDTAGAGR